MITPENKHSGVFLSLFPPFSQMTKMRFSGPKILSNEQDLKDKKSMFENFINRMLENERVVVPSRQEKNETVPDVIEEKTATEIKVLKKYQDDIEALQKMYGEKFKTGLCINLTLQEALKIMPKERARVDAFRGLISFLKAKMGITLNITSQKSKGGKL